MSPKPPEGQKAETLEELLARLPEGHSLIPSRIYYFFVMDQNGHNKGYVTTGGEVLWWANGLSGRCA